MIKKEIKPIGTGQNPRANGPRAARFSDLLNGRPHFLVMGYIIGQNFLYFWSKISI